MTIKYYYYLSFDSQVNAARFEINKPHVYELAI